MKITVSIHFNTLWGETLYVLGSLPELGSSNPALAKEMQYMSDGCWSFSLELPTSISMLKYRYLLMDAQHRIIREEPFDAHLLTLPEQGDLSLYLLDHWQDESEDLAFYSSAFTKSWFNHLTSSTAPFYDSSKNLRLHVTLPCLLESQSLYIAGNQSALGNWNPMQGKQLATHDSIVWTIELNRQELSFPVEFKFLIRDEDQQVVWEEGENRLLTVPALAVNDWLIYDCLSFRQKTHKPRFSGSVIPVFSLRSEQSFGVGDFSDLRKFIDWAALTQQRLIQILPINDTTATHAWTDSYPYSAISIYALHPMYISLQQLGALSDKKQMAFYAEKQKTLNALDQLNYEEVMRYKLDYCKAFYDQEGVQILNQADFQSFFKRNESWLIPYAAFCYLRDLNQSPDFRTWKSHSVYDANTIKQFCCSSPEITQTIQFYYFLQYILHSQLRDTVDYAHEKRIVLKGDLPIGISRTSVEAWTDPAYFRMDAQAGAPPDDFSVNGQNWLFPTYNWGELEKKQFVWWKNRFQKLEDYFDCFRIDHILGFFRIWEIPLDYVEGLCGHFNPALPYSHTEIEQFGFSEDIEALTKPQIHTTHLFALFGELSEEVIDAYLARISSNYFTLKPFCDTQQKIQSIFLNQTDKNSERVKKGLFHIANEVLFLRDPYDKKGFHPRISASQSFLYQSLDQANQRAYDQLYQEFFYHRHNQFWKQEALKRLTPLIHSTQMLVCGEDLGMIPASVPEVMNQLQIFSLEIERMPKASGIEFTDLLHLPYHSVCTTSTHDMSTVRGWWEEDRAKTQRYYNQILHHEGEAPISCTPELAEEILRRHLAAPAMLTILPLQDWLSLSADLQVSDPQVERINIPAQTNHYWRYRMHLTIEQLLNATDFNNRIIQLIKESNRG